MQPNGHLLINRFSLIVKTINFETIVKISLIILHEFMLLFLGFGISQCLNHESIPFDHWIN